MIQVAFAGHNRPQDLGEHGPVSEALTHAFRLLKAAGAPPARLLTGLASGADELAVAAWRAEAMGPIHAVFPFLEDPDGEEARAGELADSVTWLDGAALAAEGRNPHLKQTRVIVEAADLVVVVWTGGPARGAGGTADAVSCALEIGLPVLWIRPSEPHPLRLIRPDALPLDFHFPEFQEALEAGRLDHLELATVENLRDVLNLDAVSQPLPAKAISAWQAALDRWLHATLWKTYGNFRKLVGGRIRGSPPTPPPPSLAAEPGFQVLTEAYLASDQVANRLSAIHRSEQILLVLAMIAAAVVGSAWAVWPHLKMPMVALELAISTAAVLLWAAGSDAGQHERWSEQRYLAEQLRLERAGWTLGISIAPIIPAASRRQSEAWLSARRTAGLPNVRFDADRVKAWGAWAMDELVTGQSAYHHATSDRDGRIAHRIHFLEDAGFMFLFVSFAAFLSFFGLSHAHPPGWIAGSIAMIGTVVPAVAAATMALEAKLEFQEQSARSRRIASVLDELAARLGPAPSLDALQNAARAAVRLHMAEASNWREGSSRRRLFRP